MEIWNLENNSMFSLNYDKIRNIKKKQQHKKNDNNRWKGPIAQMRSNRESFFFPHFIHFLMYGKKAS
jgi:hypothetical protein